MPSLTIFLKLLAIISLCSLRVQASPTVEIKNGTLEGSLMTSRKGREFFAFRGIPFALPPIGSLRFQGPKPAAAWEGIRMAKENGNKCIQESITSEGIEGSEDCLYLNVYTPKLPNSSMNNTQVGLPVMIWIHGGGFYEGTGNSDYCSPIYFLDHDVVFVTVNYRLGPLGFLSTEDMVSPGNYGVKDQVQSIKWVRENIATFGGDPNNITLLGESAGAASVNFHMISPQSRGLFHRAISQSGSSLSAWALTKPTVAKKHAKHLAMYLKCSTSSSEELIACLNTKDAADIIRTKPIFPIFGGNPLIPFRLVIEPDHPEAFITQEPVKYFENGEINDVPWISGVNSHEGAVAVMTYYRPSGNNGTDRSIDKAVTVSSTTLLLDDIYADKYLKNISRQIIEYYFGNENINISSKFKLIDMFSDAWINYDVYTTIKHHLQVFHSPVYYYYFSYKGELSIPKSFGIVEDLGVCHADEVFYLFPLENALIKTKVANKSVDDGKMIDLMTSLWCNFAKTGNPTPEITETLPVKWEPVTTKALEYFAIGSPKNLTMLNNLNSERMAFWESLSSYRVIY